MKINQTTITEFILLGFTDVWLLRLLLFCILFFSYFMTVSENAVIIAIVHIDHRLHTPMYFFLQNLSFLEIGFTTTIIPQTLAHLSIGYKSISYVGCVIQSFLYFLLGTTEFFLLAVMSYDRYVAICNPLRYPTIMNNRVCMLLVLSCWFASLFIIIGPAMLFLQLPICGSKVLDHFFCDNTPLVNLLCGDTRPLEILEFITAILSLLGTLTVSVVSYCNIIRTVLRIPSAKGRQKALSTCASHFIVVSITYGSCIFLYVKPMQNKKLSPGKVVAILNTVVSPFLNPFIYSLRNKQVQEALRDAFQQLKGLLKGSSKT